MKNGGLDRIDLPSLSSFFVDDGITMESSFCFAKLRMNGIGVQALSE